MRSGQSTRYGFTLIELLVAISIVGILMGLLIPAVNGARESARRTKCANHLRNLSLAAAQYEIGHRQYPGYLQNFGEWTIARIGSRVSAPGLPGVASARALPTAAATALAASTTSSTNLGSTNLGSLGTGVLEGTLIDPSDPLNAINLPHSKLGTWAVSLLPYLDGQATYEIWTQDRYPLMTTSAPTPDNYNPIAVPSLEIFQCPSDPNDGDGEYGRNSYVSNNGYVDPTGGLVPGEFASSMRRANGIFNNKYSGKNLLHNMRTTPVGPSVRADDLRDGLSNTAIFSENLNAERWYRVGLKSLETQALIAPALHLNAVAVRGYQGMVWQRFDDAGADQVSLPPAAARINGWIDLDLVKEDSFRFNAARPSSTHSDGVNVVFADGSVRFVRDSIDYRTYQALLTPHGKASDVPFPEFMLRPDSY